MKKKKLEPNASIQALYNNTIVLVADILERNEQHSKNMVRAARIAEGDAKAFSTTCTVAELLEKLNVLENWDDTDLLEKMVYFLPEEARTLAMRLLERYNWYLDVYDEAVQLKDSFKDVAASPEVTKTKVSVEVTKAKDINQFTKKDCKEMFTVLLCTAWKIPRNKITVIGVWSGDSTTVAFSISKAFRQNIILYSFEENTLWFFKELRITRVRIPGAGLFELNVSQLLTHHFKEALRSGLSGNMDYWRATKVCALQM